MRKLLLLAALSASITTAFVGISAAIYQKPTMPTSVFADPVPRILNCGAYSTNLDSNISEELVAANIKAPTAVTTDLVDVVTVSNFNSNESKDGRWVIGSSSKKGALTITLSNKIDAVGFYAAHWDHASEKHTISVAGETVTLTNEKERYFVELKSPADEINFSALVKTGNRFLIYSIGFYTKNQGVL